MQWKDRCCTCCMYVQDFWKIKKFIKKTHVKIQIKKKIGFWFYVDNLKRKKAYIFGFLFFLIIIGNLTSRIWKIEIYGNHHYTYSYITKYLKTKENLVYGIRKNRIDCARLDENLRINFPEISWVSTNLEGTSLIIRLEEGISDQKNDLNELSNQICSDANGTIVAMVTRSGTPKKSIGDEVHMGDVLIDGHIDIYDDSLNVIESRNVGADGDIWIKTTEKYHKIYPLNSKSSKYEKPKFKFSFYLGDFIYTVGNDFAIKEGNNYQYITQYYEGTNGYGAALEIYRPVEIIPALKSSNDAKTTATKEMSKRLQEYNELGVQILENNVKIIMYGDRVEAIGEMILIRPVDYENLKSITYTEFVKNGENYEYNGNDN